MPVSAASPADGAESAGADERFTPGGTAGTPQQEGGRGDGPET